MAFLLLHLGDPERAVAEVARVLRPGGKAAFSAWDEPSRGRWIGVFFEAITAAGARPPATVPVGPDFFRFADDAEFTALLEAHRTEDGFDVPVSVKLAAGTK
jgi:SAM-dependent methyltransferase